MDLRRFRQTTTFQACILACLALLAALVSNALSSPERKLRWCGVPLALTQPIEPVKPAGPAPPAQPALPSITAKPVPALVSPRKETERVAVQETPAFAADPAQPVREIAGKDADRAFRLKIPFLDARRSAEYIEGHVAGAWCLPVWESDLEARITVFEASLRVSSKDPLVIYCSGGDCEDSHMLASKLMALGYRNLLIYRAGFPEWLQLGHPIEKGARP